MNIRRTTIMVTIASLLLAFAAASCSSGAKIESGTPPTRAQPQGLADVRSTACTTDQLHQLTRRTHRTHVHLNERIGFLNTRRTAVKVALDSVLVVAVKERETTHLAVVPGCWVKRESYIRDGVMTVAFLMNHAGYAVLANHPANSYAAYQDTYLRVVPH